MSKNIYVDSYCGNIIAALAQDKKLLEYHIEKKNSKVVVGSIYKGRVENVIDGMQAAFVDIGLEKNGYLYAGDMLADKNDLQVDIPSILNIKPGDEIMVQAIKDPFGSKGVRLSSHLSFAGRYLVYMPTFDMIGISRKITDEKCRIKITKILEGLKIKGGFIIRTAAEFAQKSDLVNEAKYLQGLYNEVIAAYDSARAGEILYSEGNLAVRMLRDVYTSEIENVYVADQKLFDDVVADAEKRGKEVKKKVKLYNEGIDMFTYFGLDGEVDNLLRNRVNLESGAYLVIDKTEALTAIDVNTGSYTGTLNLETTVYETNLLAAREIARQVRLRNIGGIVIVDFINMDSEQHRQNVVNELIEALKTDRAKCNVMGMNALGLVEFTRKKKRKESISLLVKNCPYCKGDGTIFSNDYIVLKIRTALLDVFAEGYSSAIVDLNVEIMSYILQRGALSKDVQKIWKNKRIYIVPHKTYHQEYFSVRGDNSSVLELPDKAKILY
ncbi:MAG: Rne/Rng family ribonuclease [Clostridia bacterium]|nr:Rne/Rng family ribonuclease [Clostridia bacterium]